MTDAPERVPLKARVKMTYGMDADDPTPNQVTSSTRIGIGTVNVMPENPLGPVSIAPPVRLDVGAGKIVRPGFVAVGREHGTEVYPLSYAARTVDEIVASHVLEHFPHGWTQAVMDDWFRALKPGGRIRIAVPDFVLIQAEYFSEPACFELVQRWIMGGQTDANDYHQAIFDYSRLRHVMIKAGLIIVGRWESEIDDCARERISLNIEGRKP